jgi:hypothetical protein
MSGFPREIIKQPIWCLYDNTNGQTVLKHPYWSGLQVPCPHCGKPLKIENYKSTCCGFLFSTGFGEIRQREPFASHTVSHGRGWASLRPYKRMAS